MACVLMPRVAARARGPHSLRRRRWRRHYTARGDGADGTEAPTAPGITNVSCSQKTATVEEGEEEEEEQEDPIDPSQASLEARIEAYRAVFEPSWMHIGDRGSILGHIGGSLEASWATRQPMIAQHMDSTTHSIACTALVAPLAYDPTLLKQGHVRRPPRSPKSAHPSE
eukprot:9485081-Pyramimonas_sp.AAC.3